MIDLTKVIPEMGTDKLSDIYGDWLEENGFEGDEPADDLYMFGDISDDHRALLADFCDVYTAAEEIEDKIRASLKLVRNAQ